MMFMSESDIRAVAPAVYATAAGQGLKRYEFVSTAEIIDVLDEAGWGVRSALQPVVRRSPLRSEQTMMHRIVCAPREAVAVNGVVPQILLTNSHDGRTAVSMRAGLYRFVCANGLVVGNTQAQFRLRHSGGVKVATMEYLDHLAGLLPLIHDTTSRWDEVEVDEDTEKHYATAALQLRFGKEFDHYDPVAAAQVVRDEDEGSSLWRVFNRVQEALVHQRLDKKEGMRGRSRPLVEMHRTTKFNEALWNLSSLTEFVVKQGGEERDAFYEAVDNNNYLEYAHEVAPRVAQHYAEYLEEEMAEV